MYIKVDSEVRANNYAKSCLICLQNKPEVLQTFQVSLSLLQFVVL